MFQYSHLHNFTTNKRPSGVRAMTDNRKADKPVCVTGATGYVAAYILRDLLAKGYSVRGTVRSLNNDAKIAPLRQLPLANTSLQLVEADMYEHGNFREILSGCSALIHTATPIYYPPDGSVPFKTTDEAYEKQVKPALEGTQALLEAAVAEGVKKVILTSSTSSMTKKKIPDAMLNEESWSDVDYARETQLSSAGGPSALAKTLQEQLAWEMSAKHGFKLMCLHPSLVLGPSFTPVLSLSMEFLIVLAKGEGLPFVEPCKPGTVPDGFMPVVDVRDVAAAHILAMEKREAHGRYLLLTHNVHNADIVRVLRETSDKFAALPETPVDSANGARLAKQRTGFDSSKVRALGIPGIPWEDTISAAAKVLESRL